MPYIRVGRLIADALQPSTTFGGLTIDGYNLIDTNTSNRCPSRGFPTGAFGYNNFGGSPANWPASCFISSHNSPTTLPSAYELIQAGPEMSETLFQHRNPQELWQKQSGAPFPITVSPLIIPTFNPTPAFEPAPVGQPDVFHPGQIWYDPISVPIPGIIPGAFPIPWRAIPQRPTNRTDRVPQERTETGPRPQPRPLPGEPFARQAYPRLRPARWRGRVPPGRRRKEEKLISQIHPRSILGRVLNGATEGADLVECIHKGLPKWLQKAKTPQARAKAIYNYRSSINWENVLVACFANQIEDFAFGKLGQLQARINRKLNLGGATIGRTLGKVRRVTY